MTGTTLRHPGRPFPASGVNLPGGRTLHLPDDLAGRFGVVLFSRGARCRYRNAQLSAFQRVLDGLAAVDASILELSVNDEATTRALIARHGLRFPVGRSADATAVADATGAFADPDPPFCRLYDHLWDPAPPEDNPAERAALLSPAPWPGSTTGQRPLPSMTTSSMIPRTSPRAGGSRRPWPACHSVRYPRLRRLRLLSSPRAAPRPPAWSGPPGVTAPQRRCASLPQPSSADRGCPMAPLPRDQDMTSWLQLLSAIEDAEAGRGTARLTETCLSVYSALAAAQFQITQLRARVHMLATSGPARTVIP